MLTNPVHGKNAAWSAIQAVRAAYKGKIET
jgi:hypothetical protein